MFSLSKKFSLTALLLVASQAFASPGEGTNQLVAKLANLVAGPRSMTNTQAFATQETDTKLVLVDYLKQAHGLTNSRTRIVLNSNVLGVDDWIVGTLTPEAAVREVSSFVKSNVGARPGDELLAAQYVEALLARGNTIGFDGMGTDECGNPGVYFLVLDPNGMNIYGIGPSCDGR